MLKEVTPALLEERPNTYTFTKSLAESLLFKHRHDLPIAVFRPSIVGASLREPMAVIKSLAVLSLEKMKIYIIEILLIFSGTQMGFYIFKNNFILSHYMWERRKSIPFYADKFIVWKKLSSNFHAANFNFFQCILQYLTRVRVPPFVRSVVL